MTDFARLVLDADTRGLKQGERDLDAVKRQSAATAREVDSNASKMGAAFKRVGVALVAAGIGNVLFDFGNVLFDFGKRSAQAAIDAEEMESAFGVVFGNMAADVRAWAEETGNALGRSTQEIQRGALAFQELFGKALQPEQAAEMSKQFAVLTQDLASFKNLSNEVAQQKLFSGLVGEAEPLRAVGVFLNEAAVQAKAAELGLKGVNGVLTDQEKIVARAAIIQEQLAAAQGDVLRTSDSAANQIKTMNAAVEELQVAVGQRLLPQLTPLISLTADVVTMMAEAAQSMDTATRSSADLVRGIRTISGVVGDMLGRFSGLLSFIGATGERLSWLQDRVSNLLNPMSALLSIMERVGRAQNATDSFNANREALGLGASLPSLATIIPPGFSANASRDLRTVTSGIGSVGTATRSAGASARAANDDFGDLFESIFPESVTRRQMQQLALIDKYQAKLEAMGVSRSQARASILGIGGPADVSSDLLNTGPLNGEVTKRIEDIVQETMDARVKTGQATQAIAESFGQMADRTLQALDRMTNAIRGGGFLDILSSVVNFGIQLGGMGVFGKGIQSNILAGARANGGMVSAGSSYLVGERGPELFTPRATGFITPRAGNDNTRISVEASPYFDVRVNGQIVQASPAIMQGGANVAARQMGRAQSRRVPG